MNYIYNIKHIHNNYMFHDKELIVNDIVWGYEPKGKRVKGQCTGDCEECFSAEWFLNPCTSGYDFEYCKRGLQPNSIPNHEGTGKVIAKYKVVEVIKTSDIKYEPNYVYPYGDAGGMYLYKGEDMGDIPYKNKDNKDYIYLLEKIEDVSMELSEFSVISKIDKGIYGECGNNLEGCNLCDHNGECPIQFNNMVNAILTRYNGLTQVILRSEKE